MPEETGRTTKRKRVLFPGEDPEDPNAAGVNVPVITKINFIDPVNRGQEYQYTIDNSAAADRTVHVDNVYPDGDTASDPLLVERIDVWRTVDPVARAQETQVSFDNVTGNDTIPPHFTTHRKTHVVRYKNDPDDGNWIDSELIDELDVVDSVNRGQETIVTLLNPQGQIDEDGKEVLTADQNDPEISDTANGIDPAWRTDPFQNIVNWSGGVYVLVQFLWSDAGTTNLGERCTLTVPEVPTYVLTGGIQSQFHSAADIQIEAVEDTTAAITDSRLINEPTTVTQGNFAGGYPIFRSCEVCGVGNYAESINYPYSDGKSPIAQPEPPCVAEPGFASPVPFDSYTKAFLFDILPSNPAADPPTQPTTMRFDITGIPNPKPWFYFARSLPIGSAYVHAPDPLDDPTQEFITNGTTGFRFDIWVFNKSSVDVYLPDAKFPLRKKDIDPLAVDAVDQTKDTWKTRTLDVTLDWVDSNHKLHEGYSDAEADTGATGTSGTGSTGDDTYQLEFKFETLLVGPGISGDPSEPVNRPLCWPTSPTLIVQAMLDNDPHQPPNIGDVHIRRYFYTWKAAGSEQIKPSPHEMDFDTSPP